MVTDGTLYAGVSGTRLKRIVQNYFYYYAAKHYDFYHICSKFLCYGNHGGICSNYVYTISAGPQHWNATPASLFAGARRVSTQTNPTTLFVKPCESPVVTDVCPNSTNWWCEVAIDPQLWIPNLCKCSWRITTRSSFQFHVSEISTYIASASFLNKWSRVCTFRNLFPSNKV